MAQMTDEEKRKIWRAAMRYWSNHHETIDLSKPELFDTITETDQWIDDNQADYLASLTYASFLTGSQILLIFATTALMRKGESADMLRRMLEVEVD